MINRKNVAALLGFAFVAAWISFNFGYAVLCLVGAGAFYGLAAVLEGDIDLSDLQARLGSDRSPPASGSTTSRVR